MVLALTTGTIGLLGASAMAGYVGGGGVGDLALTYGYEKMNTPLNDPHSCDPGGSGTAFTDSRKYDSGKLRQHK